MIAAAVAVFGWLAAGCDDPELYPSVPSYYYIEQELAHAANEEYQAYNNARGELWKYDEWHELMRVSPWDRELQAASLHALIEAAPEEWAAYLSAFSELKKAVPLELWAEWRVIEQRDWWGPQRTRALQGE